MSVSFQRDLLRGSLDLMVLSVLADNPQYGYSIQKQIRDVSQGRVDLKAGTLYPLLHRLEAAVAIRAPVHVTNVVTGDSLSRASRPRFWRRSSIIHQGRSSPTIWSWPRKALVVRPT